ncbi:hypothetical protein ANO11243_059940 [Dothideomycetidae sp. 11243]|nr:hypothetical protein ANO11243_059940 [fungal sp. No.11243]
MPRSRVRAPELRSELTAPSQDDDYKRLIVFCDGTWLNASGNIKMGGAPPSNVTRLMRAVLPQTDDGTKQIVYYNRGVGATGGLVDKIYGGLTGEGLAENVRESYSFISSNYRTGDEIFLFGFSRGAFTARAVADLIGHIGILTRKGEQYLSEIYADVRHRHDEHYVPAQPNKPFRNKPSAKDPRYRAELRHRGLTTLGVMIRVVGVWDTVGALGTPRIGWLERIGLQSSVSKRMQFYDTKLSPAIEHAFHALALDERRAAFSPALWELSPSNTTTRLRQVWFPGVHANIGGGYPDQQLANITLAWMMSQLRDLLELDQDYVLDEQDATDTYYERVANTRPRPWSFGEIYNSLKGIWAIGGTSARTPGLYKAVRPGSGIPTDVPLRHTNEYIHASVRTRLRLGGPGMADKGTYNPPAMAAWRLRIEPDDEDDRPDVYWEIRDRERESEIDSSVLPEAPLRPLEREVLGIAADQRVEEYVLNPPLGNGGAGTGGKKGRPGRRGSRLRK